MVEVVKKRGRPALTAEQKAERAAAKTTSASPKETAPKPPKAAKEPKKSAAPKGPTIKETDNHQTRVEDLSDEQHQALALQHVRKYESGLAAKKKADADFKNACKAAKSELGSEALDVIKGIVAARTESGKAMLRATVGINVMVLRWEGVPVGHMDDMFPDADRTPIDEKTFNDGKRAGLAGEPGNVPNHVSGPLINKWLGGHAEGVAALNSTRLGGIKQKDSAPAAADETEDEPSDEDAYAMGVSAFERGDAGLVPDGMAGAEATLFLEGWGSMSKLAAKKADDAQGQSKQVKLANAFALGVSAKERGSSGSVPSEMTDAEAEEFKKGFASTTAKAIDYGAQGAAAFRAGEPCEVPDAVPLDQRGTWRESWIQAKVNSANAKVGNAPAAAHG